MITIFDVEFSILAILLATIASIIVGMLWYGPLFSKQWMQLVEKSPEQLQAKPTDYLMNALSALVMAIILHLFMQVIVTDNYYGVGIIVAVLGWSGFTMPIILNEFIWEGRKAGLLLLNLMHQLVTMLVMSLVIAVVLAS